MWASLNGHLEVVDKLLQHGATVDMKDEVSYNKCRVVSWDIKQLSNSRVAIIYFRRSNEQ